MVYAIKYLNESGSFMTKPVLTGFVEPVRISGKSLLHNADNHVRFFAEKAFLKNK
jgi:hypothetical protein